MKACDLKLGSSLKALCKMLLKSRRTRRPAPTSADSVVILANGPSLRPLLDSDAERLSRLTTLCVNFMACAPEFAVVRPRYYVLADPHFFTGLDQDNVRQLWHNLAHVTWKMTILVPVERRRRAMQLLGSNAPVEVATFNNVGIEAWPWLERTAFSRGWAMPRPRNVLIPAIMTAMSLGVRRIYIAGADHSWMETLRVDNDNNVVSVQPHFYADSKAETTRSVAEYRGYRLHDIIYSFYVAFSSYHSIARYAASRGVDIYNSTPGSYIDAFPRRPLPQSPPANH